LADDGNCNNVAAGFQCEYPKCGCMHDSMLSDKWFKLTPVEGTPMASSEKDEEIAQMIEDCEKRQEKMSEWEQGFIDSIDKQLGDGRALSIKQLETLEAIWDKIT